MIFAKLLQAYFLEPPYLIPVLHGILTVAGVRAWIAHAAYANEISSRQSEPVQKLAQRVRELGGLGIPDAVAQERHAVEETLAAYEDRIRAMANAILLLGVCATLVGVFKATNDENANKAINDTLKLVAEPFAYTAAGALWAVVLLWLQSSASKLRASAVSMLCHVIDEAWAEGYREYQERGHQGMADALVPVMEELVDGLEGFQSKAFEDFSSSIGGLGDVVSSLQDTLSKAQASAQNQSAATAATADSVKRLAGVLEQMGGVEANYAKLTNLGETFKSEMGGAKKAFEAVAGSTAIMVRDSAENFKEAMDKVHGQLLSVAGQLAAVEQYAASSRGMAERLDTVAERFDRLFADYAAARQEQAHLMANIAADAIRDANAASAAMMREAVAGFAAQRGSPQRSEQGIIAAIEQLADRQRESSRNISAVTVLVAVLCAIGVGAAFIFRSSATAERVSPESTPASLDVPRETPRALAAPVTAVAADVVKAPLDQPDPERPPWLADLTICSNLAASALSCLHTCALPSRTCTPEVQMAVDPTAVEVRWVPVEARAPVAARQGRPGSTSEPPAVVQERVFRACLHGIGQLRVPEKAGLAAKVEVCMGLGVGALRQQGLP